MVKWTKYFYKRWLRTFSTGRIGRLFSPTLTSNLLPSPNIYQPWLEFELLGEGRSGPQTISAKTLEF